MTVIEINKYKPSLMKHGRYLREAWYSYANIGKTYDGVLVTRDEYLRVENQYLAAIHIVCELASVRELSARGVERWDTADELLHQHQLDDVLDGSPPVQDGEALAGPRLDNVMRRCLREAAWLELAVPTSFLIHFGHDYRLIVALEPAPDPAIARIRELGLFVYPSTAQLATLEAWGIA